MEDHLPQTQRTQQVLSSPNDGQQEHGNHNSDNDYENWITTQHRARPSSAHLARTRRIILAHLLDLHNPCRSRSLHGRESVESTAGHSLGIAHSPHRKFAAMPALRMPQRRHGQPARTTRYEMPVAEKKRLTNNDGDNRNVHGISHVPIETRHHKMLRWRDRRRRAQSLRRKPRE